MTMEAQLAAIVSAFEVAQARLHRLVDALPAPRWSDRPGPDRWSAAGAAPGRRYRRDPAGWLLSLASESLPRLGRWRLGRVRTTAPFVPAGDLSQAPVMAEFDRLQGEQVGLVREADGLPLDRVWIRSPFDRRLRYNCYSCPTILPRHQTRHVELQLVDLVPRPCRIRDRFGVVTDNYVVPAARGAGIGGRLLAALVDHARELDLELLIVWPSGRAVPFYLRRGFRSEHEILELRLRPYGS